MPCIIPKINTEFDGFSFERLRYKLSIVRGCLILCNVQPESWALSPAWWTRANQTSQPHASRFFFSPATARRKRRQLQLPVFPISCKDIERTQSPSWDYWPITRGSYKAPQCKLYRIFPSNPSPLLQQTQNQHRPQQHKMVARHNDIRPEDSSIARMAARAIPWCPRCAAL